MPGSLRPPIPAGPWLVVGLARSGVGAIRLLTGLGHEVLGVDSGHPELPGDVAPFTRLGTDGLAELAELTPSAVVASPGVPWDAPVLQVARAAGAEVVGELELGWRASRGTVLAVTGTNGKTTTVELLAAIARDAGRDVVLAGNVGSAITELAPQTHDDTVLVLEVSSFQLEAADAFVPDVAVLLNITADHLDRHGTFDAYRDAKLKIFGGLGSDQTAVVPTGFPLPPSGPRPGPRVIEFGPGGTIDTIGGQIRCGDDVLAPAGGLQLFGRHNRLNAAAAAGAALAAGIAPESIARTLATFAGVAHRLEPAGEWDDVLWVNDSKATNVDSTLVALEAFEQRRIHLILGGRGKDQDFAPLRNPVAEQCASVLLVGEAADELAETLAGTLHAERLIPCGTLEVAVGAARELAAPGDVVLLSPACASWDQFPDYEIRGERFKELAGARRTTA